MGTAFHGGEVEETLSASPSSPADCIFLRNETDFDRNPHSAIRLLDGNREFFLNENAVSASSRAPTSVTCGCCSVRDFPMLAIRAITNTSMVAFAVMQNSLRPRTPRPLRIRSTFNIAVKNRARLVPNIQILPV
jgi:hypothetical protein